MPSGADFLSVAVKEINRLSYDENYLALRKNQAKKRFEELKTSNSKQLEIILKCIVNGNSFTTT